VPVGVTGELYIGGAGVARGYWKRPELTTERFLQDPFAGKPGARMFRTGDLGRWRADGNIEFVGRNDNQVKIRGFRIELGEIEARLKDLHGVREAVVVARENPAGEMRLVAYYTCGQANDGKPGVNAQQLRTHLAETLPEYMIPAAYVRLDSVPLTPNGKLNCQSLPEPDGNAFVVRDYEAPQGVVENTLAEIWSELLGVEQVGRHHNFFELGGHSMLAVQVAVRLGQLLSLELDVRAIFEAPTLAALAAFATPRGDVFQVPVNGIPKTEHHSGAGRDNRDIEIIL